MRLAAAAGARPTFPPCSLLTAALPALPAPPQVQAAKAAAGGTFLKWPKQLAEQYGPAFLLALFAAILVWEDVW